MSLSNDRLPEPPSAGFEDDEAAHEYGRQLAMDLVLHRLYHPSSGSQRSRKVVTWLPWLTRVGMAAAAVLVVGSVFLFQRIHQKTPETRRWKVEPEAAAEFTVVEPFRVRLDRGELRVPAAPASREVTVETGFATVAATGAEFRISLVSEPQDPPRPFGPLEVTTIEVVSGSVTLTTPEGTIVGQTGETLIAVEGEAPGKK